MGLKIQKGLLYSPLFASINHKTEKTGVCLGDVGMEENSKLDQAAKMLAIAAVVLSSVVTYKAIGRWERLTSRFNIHRHDNDAMKSENTSDHHIA